VVFTEASKKKRASLHLVRAAAGIRPAFEYREGTESANREPPEREERQRDRQLRRSGY
jgi:hypothetical protein